MIECPVQRHADQGADNAAHKHQHGNVDTNNITNADQRRADIDVAEKQVFAGQPGLRRRNIARQQAYARLDELEDGAEASRL